MKIRDAERCREKQALPEGKGLDCAMPGVKGERKERGAQLQGERPGQNNEYEVVIPQFMLVGSRNLFWVGSVSSFAVVVDAIARIDSIS